MIDRMNDGLNECDKVSIEGGTHPQQLQILVLIAAAALPSADEPILPLVRGPDRGERPGLLVVLPPQLFDFAFQILVPCQHAIKSHIAIMRQDSGILHGTFAALILVILTTGVALNLLLQPHILVH